MRILIVTETYSPNVNGAALATERLAKILADQKNIVSVVAPSTSFKHFKTKQGKLTIYRLRSILVQKTQELRVSPTLLHTKEFVEIMEQTKPDIMHINNPGFIAQTAINAAKEYNVPIIGTSHFMAENLTHYLHLPDQIEKLLNTSIWKMYARFYSRLSLIIAPTPTAATLLKRLKVTTKIEVISNGIDLEKFNPKNNGDYLKKRYKIPSKPIVLFLGRIDKEKNIDVLIRAIYLLKSKVDFHTVIVGKGKEEASLKRLAEELGIADRVTFTGYLPKKDLANIYKIGDIFAMPSIAELQCLVVMEAMATGLPVVGANAVALPHLVKHNRNGYLFKQEDERDLAKGLLRLLKDKNLREGMGEESLKIIGTHDINVVVREVEQVYENIIKLHKSTHVLKIRTRKRDVLKKFGKSIMNKRQS